jgi:hypothetical protein
MAELLKKTEGSSFEDFLIKDRFEEKLDLIKLIYKQLLAIRDDYSPYTYIIVDCYDYILPSYKAAKLFSKITVAGPWLKPMLDGHGCTDPEEQVKFAKYLIDGFYKILKELENEHERFIVIDTRGSVMKNEWQNEIHPNSDASKRVAQLFIAEIEKLG